ncbi:uncharacterized protein PG998_008329 [Apiospora kogelbergensis]|uniref:uncharacterized protein n=1 Tax=Apiospora kogelbergensis TaxID=1337665 RepID=UPI00312FD92E
MNSLWLSKAGGNDAAPSDGPNDTKDPVGDLADTGVAAETTTANPPTAATATSPMTTNNSSATAIPMRPGLPPRNSMPPNPPTQPAPAPPGGQQQPPDSLSLAQLRRIVSEFPRSDAVVYDFAYSDTGPHAEELDEWFVYQFWQWVRLNAAHKSFEWHWDQQDAAGDGAAGGNNHHSGYATWDDASDAARNTFVAKALDQVSSADDGLRTAAIGRLVYIVLGRWCDTAGAPILGDRSKLRTVATPDQLAAISSGVKLLAERDGLPVIWNALQNALDTLWQIEPSNVQPEGLQEKQDELMNLMTIMYTTLQEILNDRAGMATVQEKLLSLDPNVATYMLSVVAKMRWLESPTLPMTHILLLLWKSLLVVFGGTEEIEETKKALSEAIDKEQAKDTITASPLDYHVFRQEISSKYPAYVPPQLPLPLEADNTSLLPQLPNHPTRNNGSNGILPAPPNSQSGGASILHQPVHIATPAPSPPPSPAVGGKGGKKQNYQTNQNFPFMYPPLDATSNSAGGKGPAGLQNILVGRRWEGSDIPASILEAGELFSKRVRMTRATRQLWEEREKFLKFDRGWDPTHDDDVDDLDLDSLGVGEDDEVDEEKLLAKIEARTAKTEGPEIDYGKDPENLDRKIKGRLEAVESLYVKYCLTPAPVGRHRPDEDLALQHHRGHHLTATPRPGRNAQQLPGAQQAPNLYRSHDSSNGTNGTTGQESPDMSLDDLDQARAREIEGKALTGIALLLLKWFKISHVLKFEYMTQLLLDSNYLPLVLKLFAHQDVQQVVDSRTDRLDHSFFYFCNQRAHPVDKPMEPTEIDGADEEEESEDEAAPPPIKRKKSPPRPQAGVDELGYPINPMPKEPITDYSRRNFFSLINYLRILQKICKNKAHRNLLLVQYKSSNIIRKSLRVPQPELRLYTLKLFKNQVPYCGRKWRQSNMRVITAVYLHCRPELRDEWLAGSDVDAEVEEALPLEQALRSLTHCPAAENAVRDEQDFFKRELEKLEVVWLADPGVQDAGGMMMGGGPVEWEQQQAQQQAQQQQQYPGGMGWA